MAELAFLMMFSGTPARGGRVASERRRPAESRRRKRPRFARRERACSESAFFCFAAAVFCRGPERPSARVQAMARLGLEPRTPQFSVVGRPTWLVMRRLAKRRAFAGISSGLRRQLRPAPSAEIPADTRRCRGVWADEWGPSAQTKTGETGGWREADCVRADVLRNTFCPSYTLPSYEAGVSGTLARPRKPAVPDPIRSTCRSPDHLP